MRGMSSKATLPAPLTGRDAGRQFMQMYVSAFPDLHFDIDQIFGDGDFVATRWTATGTHRGELMGIKPTIGVTRRRGRGDAHQMGGH